MSMAAIRVLIAESHVLVREGLRLLCEQHGLDVVADVGSLADTVAAARRARADVVVFSIGSFAPANLRQLGRKVAPARLLALTLDADQQLARTARRAGAHAWVPMTVDARELMAAIESVHRGDVPLMAAIPQAARREALGDGSDQPPGETLTESELAVLRLVARGMESLQIADRLRYSPYTIANRLRSIYRKIRVKNRTEAALYAIRSGLADADTRAP